MTVYGTDFGVTASAVFDGTYPAVWLTASSAKVTVPAGSGMSLPILLAPWGPTFLTSRSPRPTRSFRTLPPRSPRS